MINYTTKDLLKILPLDEALRAQLLKEFDTYSESKQFELSSLCWSMFNGLTNELTDIKLQEYFAEAKNGKRKLTSDMYTQARRAVHEDYKDILSGKKQAEQEVEHIRAKLHALIQNQKTSSTN